MNNKLVTIGLMLAAIFTLAQCVYEPSPSSEFEDDKRVETSVSSF